MAEAAARSISGDGTFTKLCSRWLEAYFSCPKALLTTSCTHALEMSAMLLDIVPGDEVIVPSFTFVSTVNAFVLRGARPVFIDIRPDTLNLDERLLEPLITPRTRAIVPVHYAGAGCAMDEIGTIAARHGIAVIEDNAHGLFGQYRRRRLGTFGAMSTLSFHETKNLTCGEGGALIINDARYAERAEIVREKGTNRSAFFRGHVDKYTWQDAGSSYLPSDILAAFLWAQIENAERIQSRRTAIWDRYRERLAEWADRIGAQLPMTHQDYQLPGHIFYMLMPTESARDRLLEHLRMQQIGAVFHYLPLHQSPMGQKLAPESKCPVTESVSGRLLRLPLFVELTDACQERVIKAVNAFRC